MIRCIIEEIPDGIETKKKTVAILEVEESSENQRMLLQSSGEFKRYIAKTVWKAACAGDEIPASYEFITSKPKRRLSTLFSKRRPLFSTLSNIFKKFA